MQLSFWVWFVFEEVFTWIEKVASVLYYNLWENISIYSLCQYPGDLFWLCKYGVTWSCRKKTGKEGIKNSVCGLDLDNCVCFRELIIISAKNNENATFIINIWPLKFTQKNSIIFFYWYAVQHQRLSGEKWWRLQWLINTQVLEVLCKNGVRVICWIQSQI